tara:strand:+ start:6791 stop:7780 length:990 start_codon:yes stop_codon:yes gene_type:complete
MGDSTSAREAHVSFYTDKKVVVIGGAGMIGSFLTEQLVAEGAEVTVVDNLSRGRAENLAAVTHAFSYNNATKLYELAMLKGKDIVFNLAAKVTGMHYNREHHAEMFAQNMLSQIVPLQAALMWEVPYFLQASTVCVYPREMSFPVSEEEGQQGEPEPTNAGYGWAKRMGERYAQWVAQEHDIEIAISRFSNVFGPRDYFDEETSHVIPALIKRTLEEDEVEVYCIPGILREFLYVKDAARGLMELMEHYPEADPVNIGNRHNRVTIGQLAKLIQEVIGVEKPIKYVGGEGGYPRRGSAPFKMINKCKWAPEPNLREGLEATVDWYRRHS